MRLLILLAGMLIAASAATETEAAAIMRATRPWPNAIVAYRFDGALLKVVGAKGHDSTGYKKWQKASAAYKACKAMDAWHDATGVNFVAANVLRFDALQIMPGNATLATVGHLPVGNGMRIEAGASYGAVLHEFGHVLGLTHEHQRPDRAEYLTFAPFLQDDIDHCGLKLNPVCNDVRAAFPIAQMQMTTGYDPCSIMHYLANQAPRHREDKRWGHIFDLTAKGQTALSACLPAFSSLPVRCQKVGQKCAISPSDAALVRRFYGLSTN